MNYVYGGIDIDWEGRRVNMKIFTPMEKVEDGFASGISIDF